MTSVLACDGRRNALIRTCPSLPNPSNVTTYDDWELASFNGPQYDLPLWVMCCYIIVGIIGNLLSCLSIILDLKLRNVTNYLLLSSSIGDIVVSALILPGKLLTANYKLHPDKFPLCFLHLIIDDYLTTVSACHICFICMERYCRLKNEFKVIVRPKCTAGRKIGMVWFLGFVCIIPYLVSARTSKYPDRPMYCAHLLANFNLFDSVLFTESAVIVITVVVVFICLIITSVLRYVRKQGEKVEGSSKDDIESVRNVVRVWSRKTNQTSGRKKDNEAVLREQRTLRVAWIVSFAFLICMVPYACTSFSYLSSRITIIPPVVLSITAYLIYTHSIINPFIFTIFHQEFRNDFKNLILFRFKELQNKADKTVENSTTQISTVSI